MYLGVDAEEFLHDGDLTRDVQIIAGVVATFPESKSRVVVRRNVAPHNKVDGEDNRKRHEVYQLIHHLGIRDLLRKLLHDVVKRHSRHRRTIEAVLSFIKTTIGWISSTTRHTIDRRALRSLDALIAEHYCNIDKAMCT